MPAQLDPDTIDDILYFARTGDLPELILILTTQSAQLGTDARAIVFAAADASTGNTAGHYAAANGHIGKYRRPPALAHTLSILTTGADILTHLASLDRTLLGSPNTRGNTPLHYAALNGQLGAAQALLRGVGDDAAQRALLEAKNEAGCDAAFEAERTNREELVTWLLGRMDELDGGEGAAAVAAADAEEEVQDVKTSVDGVRGGFAGLSVDEGNAEPAPGETG